MHPENAHDGEALRVLTGGRLDWYLALRSEFRDQVADVRQRHQEAVRWLTQLSAPPEEQAALDRERDEVLQYHADWFAERVWALV